MTALSLVVPDLGDVTDPETIQQIYDDLTALRDGVDGLIWTSYTPSWTATGTAPALGNGTIVGGYVHIEEFVVVRFRLVMGSTTTFGTGAYKISLPVNASASLFVGAAYLRDSSATSNGHAPGICVIDGAGENDRLFATSSSGTGTGGQVTNSVPFTWANGDNLGGTVAYQAA